MSRGEKGGDKILHGVRVEKWGGEGGDGGDRGVGGRQKTLAPPRKEGPKERRKRPGKKKKTRVSHLGF